MTSTMRTLRIAFILALVAYAVPAGAQRGPLQPPLMRPMAVAHRHQPPPSPAVEGVLQLLAEFADFGE